MEQIGRVKVEIAGKEYMILAERPVIKRKGLKHLYVLLGINEFHVIQYPSGRFGELTLCNNQ